MSVPYLTVNTPTSYEELQALRRAGAQLPPLPENLMPDLSDVRVEPVLDGEEVLVFPEESPRQVLPRVWRADGTHFPVTDDDETWVGQLKQANAEQAAFALRSDFEIDGHTFQVCTDFTVYNNNEAWGRDPAPAILWETMILFDWTWMDWRWRYGTPAAARAGHEKITAALRAALRIPEGSS